jgi:hypothetical protein
MLPAQRQQHAPRRPGERGHRAIQIGHVLPAVARPGLPGGAGEGHQRHAGFLRRGHGIGAHPRGERVRRIDHMGDPLGAQPGDQARHAAKAADARGQGQHARRQVRPA